MDPDEPTRKKPDIALGENLENLSVAELEHRIHALHQEIERVTAVLDSKRASKQAADAFFRS